jgi:hypothetical protein
VNCRTSDRGAGRAGEGGRVGFGARSPGVVGGRDARPRAGTTRSRVPRSVAGAVGGGGGDARRLRARLSLDWCGGLSLTRGERVRPTSCAKGPGAAARTSFGRGSMRQCSGSTTPAQPQPGLRRRRPRRSRQCRLGVGRRTGGLRAGDGEPCRGLGVVRRHGSRSAAHVRVGCQSSCEGPRSMR